MRLRRMRRHDPPLPLSDLWSPRPDRRGMGAPSPWKQRPRGGMVLTPLYRCPWCVTVERGVKASALMRKHILEHHRALLIGGLGILESFTIPRGT